MIKVIFTGCSASVLDLIYCLKTDVYTICMGICFHIANSENMNYNP